MLKIYFDLDGVIIDVYSVFIHVVKELYDYEIKELTTVKAEELLKILPLTKEQLLNAFHETIVVRWKDCPPVDHSMIFLKAYHNLTGFTPRFVTARRGGDEKHITEKWLKTFVPNYIPYKVTFTYNDHNKISFLKKSNFDIYIDDRPSIGYELSKNRIHTVLIGQPWNKGVKENPYLRVVRDWIEAKELLLNDRRYLNDHVWRTIREPSGSNV